jgi:ABC-type uncharacterized transport system auxiliary subunit
MIWTGNNMKKKYALSLILISILFIACSKKVIVRNYYVLEFSEQTEEVELSKPLVNSSCEIFAVTIPPAFSQARIAVRKRSHEISYYQNHLWAVTPGDLIAQLIESHVQQQNIFTKASQSIWKEVPGFRIHATVMQLEAMDIDDELYSHIKMRINLFNREKNEIVVSHQFDRKEMLEEKDINLLAESLSMILKEELEIFTNKIRNELSEK